MMRHRSLGDGRGRSRLRLLGLAVLALLAGRSAGAAEPAAPDDAFVSDHCTSCHNDVSKKGRLDLTGLAFDPSDPANLAVWIKVHDRVKAGEMPPRGKARPDAARQKAFVEGLARSIVAAERAALAGEGRAIRRRLNRHEYENALRDLLGVPWAQVASRLPEDGEAYHFNKSGEALDVSYLQIARFMDSADYAMRLAMATAPRAAGEDDPQAVCPRRAEPAQLVAARERDPARPAVVPRARFARPAGRPRRPRPGDQPGDARARGGRQGVEHLQRRGRL